MGKIRRLYNLEVGLAEQVSSRFRECGNTSRSEFVRDAIRERLNGFSDSQDLETEGFATPRR